ncbi:NUDIX-like domain-containing protein, partial [Thermodesulfobacteriota bacterium]
MDHLKRSKRNCFATGAISRITDKRNDGHWIVQQLNRPNTRIAPLWRGKNLIGLSDVPQPIFFRSDQLKDYNFDPNTCLLLGETGGQVYYAIDLPSDDEAIPQKLSHLGQFQNLRSFGALIEGWSAELLAYAKAL